MKARFWPLAVLLFVAGCSGGSDGGSSNPPVAAPSNLSYSSPQTFVVAQAISPLTPTVTGTVGSYAVTPALPAGLSLNTTTGVISGTPTGITAAATYNVTATNSSGSTTANVSVRVNDPVPVIGYSEAEHIFATGRAITALTPSNSGGTATGWSISPALPDGLTFNSTDGSINGTPTVAGAAATYVITAQNSGGSDTAELSITVDPGVLLDLGHFFDLSVVRYDGNRVLSLDSSNHWVLWNATTAANLAQGEAACPHTCRDLVGLAGDTVVFRTMDGLQLRDATDGHFLANLNGSVSWWTLASDGSYVVVGNPTELRAWSRTGASLFTKTGNYSAAQAFATPSELRVAAGAAGATTLEKIAVSNATSTTVTYQGQFNSWFTDGERFLTNVSNTVYVFGLDGTQLDLRALPLFTQLGGYGDWFWAKQHSGPTLAVYTVGASATPAATVALGATDLIAASAETLAILPGGSSTTVGTIDLSAATPVKADRTIPRPGPSAYAAQSSTQWLVGTNRGVLVDATVPATPRYFGWGTAHAVAASGQHIAIATANEAILYFDAATRTQVGSIDFSASDLQLSADGTVLLAKALFADESARSFRLYSLPSGNLIRGVSTSTSTPPWVIGASISASGQVLSKELFTSSSTFDRITETVSNGTLLWSESEAGSEDLAKGTPTRLSPDGTLAAISEASEGVTVATNLYTNGVIGAAANGVAAGWLDNNRVLLTRYRNVMANPVYLHSAIVNALGQDISTVVLPGSRQFQVVSPQSIYFASPNVIVSLTDGGTLWSSPNPNRGRGGVTPSHVIFVSGATVRAEPY